MSPRVDWLLSGSLMSLSTNMAYTVMSKYAHTDSIPSYRYMSREHTKHRQTCLWRDARKERGGK
jgi:hypothetical protein